jgi:hypothetical protein
LYNIIFVDIFPKLNFNQTLPCLTFDKIYLALFYETEVVVWDAVKGTAGSQILSSKTKTEGTPTEHWDERTQADIFQKENYGISLNQKNSSLVHPGRSEVQMDREDYNYSITGLS